MFNIMNSLFLILFFLCFCFLNSCANQQGFDFRTSVTRDRISESLIKLRNTTIERFDDRHFVTACGYEVNHDMGKGALAEISAAGNLDVEILKISRTRESNTLEKSQYNELVGIAKEGEILVDKRYCDLDNYPMKRMLYIYKDRDHYNDVDLVEIIKSSPNSGILFPISMVVESAGWVCSECRTRAEECLHVRD